ncbi:sugar phosphate isomerase/epimerase [Caballeronia sp. LZ043]|uniref:sugar phosphate isomerase/epimerase family protein n=1 Tax=Caballeronia sp. LZ043 TaxID=3038569 RepID=UPI0028589672|nr:sugar phosphate isomerase/epimerase [Caballeronia sp. LZ043]MDR5826200.1 sugar phosphate isomerase/epimerase [Caballeronia sp. LZ043]
MTPGVFARTYTGLGLRDLFARVKADGFYAVQFNLSCAGLGSLPPDLPHGITAQIVSHLQEEGVSICALSGTYNMAHPDDAQRKHDRVGFANVLRAADEMNVPLVTLCTGSRDISNMWRAHPDNTTTLAWTTLCDEMALALRMAEDLGLVLGIEPEPGNVVADSRCARRILDEMKTTRLGIVLDAANLLPPEVQGRQSEIIDEAVDLLGGSLRLVHAKDTDAVGKVVPAGKGVVDFPAFIKKMREAGYTGPLIAHNIEESDAPGVAAYLSKIIREDAQ